MTRSSTAVSSALSATFAKAYTVLKAPPDEYTAPVAVGGGLAVAVLSAGDNTSCGVTTGRVAHCWGDNQFGQLGDGSQTNRLLPTKVTFQP